LEGPGGEKAIANGKQARKTEHPDHLVVIKYMPVVGDSKRAIDECTSRPSLRVDGR
jgi:myo-inositol-1-phosphate synthase